MVELLIFLQVATSISDFFILDNCSLLSSISKSTWTKVNNKISKILDPSSNKLKLIVLVNEDYTELWNTMREKISLVKHDKICPGQGSFGHITSGCDAGYYG